MSEGEPNNRDTEKEGAESFSQFHYGKNGEKIDPSARCWRGEMRPLGGAPSKRSIPQKSEQPTGWDDGDMLG